MAQTGIYTALRSIIHASSLLSTTHWSAVLLQHCDQTQLEAGTPSHQDIAATQRIPAFQLQPAQAKPPTRRMTTVQVHYHHPIHRPHITQATAHLQPRTNQDIPHVTKQDSSITTNTQGQTGHTRQGWCLPHSLQMQ